MNPSAEPTNLQLAVALARAHGRGGFVFWRSDDWNKGYGVSVARIDSEFVTVRCVPIGDAKLATP